MGLTYKENVSDKRETVEIAIIKEFKTLNCEIYGDNPVLDKEEVYSYGIKTLGNLNVKRDYIIINIAYDNFKRLVTLDNIKDMLKDNPILIDERGMFNEDDADGSEFHSRGL